MKSSGQYPLEEDANVLADGWSGYKPLKQEYPYLKQTLSDRGKNFKMLHIQIRNFKNWLTKCIPIAIMNTCKNILMNTFSGSTEGTRISILDKIIERCILHEPVSYAMIKTNAIQMGNLNYN